ncbi:MAG: ribosome maturation factor RimP [Acidobacteriales bacterium]|nr:ribosome maturation factor RimP [Terriglobales bacterium]
MAFDLEQVRSIVDRVAASSGLEVVDMELRGAGKSRMLRIFIDKLERDGTQLVAENHPADVKQTGTVAASQRPGVTLEDCANLSREVGTILDVEDAIPGGSYVLEVSSPGLDRKLSRPADFERFVGSRVKLTTRQPVNGERHFAGRLENYQDGRLILDGNMPRKKSRSPEGAGTKFEIELSNVEKANLVPEI